MNAALPATSATFLPTSFPYAAFVSYARADKAQVDDMYRRLSAFRTPRALRRERGDFGTPPLALRLFLDRKSAQLGGLIPDRLKGAISHSAFLIVFCSRSAAASVWVAREIEAFLEHSTSARILPVFLRGTATEPLAPLLPAPLAALGDALPMGGDLVVDGGPGPVAHKLLGAMLGFPQDKVAREQEAADRRRRTVERATLGVIASLSTVAAAAGWRAYAESKKAETSLQVSLSALDKTTPFAQRLVAEGRVTTAEVEGFAGQLDRVFASFSDTQLQNLPDIRFSLGQVLRTSAQLRDATGAPEQRLADASRALRLLRDFVDEPGPDAQLAICSAALESASAYGAMQKFENGLADARACDDIADHEAAYHVRGDAATQALAARRVLAKNMEARLYLAQDQFSEALAALDEARNGARLGALGATLLSTRLDATLWSTRGAILEECERYAEATSAYRRASDLFTQSDTPSQDMLPTQLGLVRSLAQFSETRAQALVQIDALIEDVTTRTERDTSLRALRATLAALHMERANMTADAPTQSATVFESALADLAHAGAIDQALLAFDPENLSWRLQEAGRLSMLGEVYFRIAETLGADAPACVKACLAQAEAAFLRSLSNLSKVRQTPLIAHQTAEVQLRIGRTLRHAGDVRADAWIEQAAQSHARLRAMVGDTRALRMQGARITDERADLAAAKGQNGKATALYEQALAVLLEAATAEPDWIAVRRDFLWSSVRFAESLAAAGDTRAAGAFDAACSEAGVLAVVPSRLMKQDRARLAASAARYGRACPGAQ